MKIIKGNPVTIADKTGSCTGVMDCSLLQVQSTTEVLICWNRTCCCNMWISLSSIHPNYTEKQVKRKE